MAAYTYSNSPRVRALDLDPVTPIHSPHHSVNSSTSSRTPLHTLSIHEYRRQQNSPASQTATPPGRTLRRKAAAPALDKVERVPSVSSPPLSISRQPLRPLHVSQSAYQLNAYQPLPPSPPHFSQEHGPSDQPIRSQSAEPFSQGAAGFRGLSISRAGKIREFKPIKRLPKPIAASGFGLPSPVAVTPTQSHFSPLRTTSFPSLENSNPGDTQNTPSTFSLSRFPQPPHLIDPSLSPPNDENVPLHHLNTANFTTTTAPATPPATPAIVHYRGASFDVVNPHDSLDLENIVTPSREIDSTDYLPLQSSEDHLEFSEMAPKRALYGDLTSAYASIITRRNDDSPSIPNLDLPLPPTPVARSPGSSQYTTPLHSPDSNFDVSPLAVKKPVNESRFSLKQLTRTLTKRLGRTPEKTHEEELHDLDESRISLASVSFNGEFPRPLGKSYKAVTPKSSIYADDLPTPVSPLSPFDQAMDLMNKRDSDVSIEQPRFSTHRYSSAPLTSMVPDDPSTQLGRASDPQFSITEDNMFSRPYYDDLGSIYPSSSIYTGDDRGHSNYPSISSGIKSSPFMRMSNGADILANEYKSDGLYRYPSSRQANRRVSRPLTQELFHRSIQQGNDKTDTISKFIDQYKQGDGSNTSQPILNEGSISDAHLVTHQSATHESTLETKQPQGSRAVSGLSQFEFDLPHTAENSTQDETDTSLIRNYRTEPYGLTYAPGLPPSMPAPLAPPFQYGLDHQPLGHPGPSEIFSGVSSYGDTRQLLQLSQPVADQNSGEALEPSSSYSQSEALSALRTPTEALKQADEIFENAVAQKQIQSIPAMWARRSSGNLLPSRSEIDNTSAHNNNESAGLKTGDEGEAEVGDWETVGHDSQGGRMSPGESLADYSSSNGSRESMGFSSSLPVWEDQPLESDSFEFQYQHPSPLGAHTHPFDSSPPPLATRASARFSPDKSPTSSAVVKASIPTIASANLDRPGNANARDASSDDPVPFIPWTNPFALSDKETQELLASGPNEEILYEASQLRENEHSEYEYATEDSSPLRSVRAEPPTTSTLGDGLERENTFEKLSALGPKGNLTGTPQGTGMHEAGSSPADNSSPGAMFDSSPFDRQKRMGGVAGHYEAPSRDYEAPSRVYSTRRGLHSYVSSSNGDSGSSSDALSFYAIRGRTGSVNRVPPPLVIPKSAEEHERTPSQVTLFPQPIPESPFMDSSRRSSRRSLRSSLSAHRPRRQSRAAVPGQTKLRQMVLSPDSQTLSSSHSTHISRFIGTAESERPSSSNTHTPLRTHVSESTLRSAIANEHSPHLLCPERAMDPVEEEQRRKLSWIIFAVFCALPPLLLLYRWMGDFVIVNVTRGHIMHVAPKPKRIALGVGIAVNLTLSAAILLPILIAHATGAL